jgi:hypothetical protein
MRKADLWNRTAFRKGVQFNSCIGVKGEANMTSRAFTIVSALVPALGVATALARPTAQAFVQFDQAGIIYQSTLLWPYDRDSAMAANAAYVGDGSDPSYLGFQQQVTKEPGYSFSN